MKRMMVMLFILLSSQIFAQQKKNVIYLTKEEFVGTWQKGSKVVGSGLNQHFVFNKDGKFILNLYSNGDDARNLLKIKGKYRLFQNELYLTITSRLVADGEIVVGDMAITSSLLQFNVIKIKRNNGAEPERDVGSVLYDFHLPNMYKVE